MAGPQRPPHPQPPSHPFGAHSLLPCASSLSLLGAGRAFLHRHPSTTRSRAIKSPGVRLTSINFQLQIATPRSAVPARGGFLQLPVSTRVLPCLSSLQATPGNRGVCGMGSKVIIGVIKKWGAVGGLVAGCVHEGSGCCGRCCLAGRWPSAKGGYGSFGPVPPLRLGELVSSHEETLGGGLRPGKLAAWVVRSLAVGWTPQHLQTHSGFADGEAWLHSHTPQARARSGFYLHPQFHLETPLLCLGTMHCSPTITGAGGKQRDTESGSQQRLWALPAFLLLINTSRKGVGAPSPPVCGFCVIASFCRCLHLAAGLAGVQVMWRWE